ncbi:MAG: CRISPR-associated endonuclease Cas1 [Desulfomonilaceae bacterium]
MTVLYLTEDGSVLRKRGERLVVEKEDKELLEVRLRGLTSVLMLDTVQVTTQALVEMLKFGVEFAILSHRGKLLGQLTPPLARNIFLRKAQFQKETDAVFDLLQAKQIISVKVINSKEVLTRYVWDGLGDKATLDLATAKLEVISRTIESATDRDQLLGLEGSAAAVYWKSFATLFKVPDISFIGRRKHPAPDPVNAILSFGYALLTNTLQSLLDGVGFDPFLGFFHEEDYGRPSLALDLVEPFRAPVVDRFTVRLFNLGILKPTDFVLDQEGGLCLSKQALRTFFQQWESLMVKMDIRRELRTQVETLAKVYTGEEPRVKPWIWRAR